MIGVLRRNRRFDEALTLLDDFAGAQRHDYWRIVALDARAAITRDMGNLDASRGYYRQALSVPGITAQQSESIRKQLNQLGEVPE